MSLDIFPQFLERTNIVYFPFISDSDEFQKCDIALVEGAVLNEEHIQVLRNVKKNATKIYALGNCASFGSPLSFPSVKDAEPISNYIEINGFIPGCPPPANLLGNCLMRFIENKDIVLNQKTMCASCSLREENDNDFKEEINSISPKRDSFLTKEEDRKCFLKEGVLCLGPITRDGCEHLCIKQGLPCIGCMGPPSKDFTSNLVNFLSMLNLSEEFKHYFSKYFSLSEPKTRG